MSGERAFYFWHKTEGYTGYNSRLLLPTVQSSDSLHCWWELNKNPNRTPKTRALQYQKVDNHTLLLHTLVKHLSGHPSFSTLVLPTLRLLVINKESSGKKIYNLLTSKTWHSWLTQWGQWQLWKQTWFPSIPIQNTESPLIPCKYTSKQIRRNCAYSSFSIPPSPI